MTAKKYSTETSLAIKRHMAVGYTRLAIALLVLYINLYVPARAHCYSIRYGLVVRIFRFHRKGPGSIPGIGAYFFFFS